ncbi:hypothetical protein BZB76_1519 [Actinomadura pelletieri DSM 43383]|uniref:Polymerase nucleotidyl transferase domain-containing protein n=2 Tax=Actinomadura pelletieri TaxID=111805 RepID=A0A495QRQ3_9ACTN|nr:hypothetical protein BZB76_1519 [Actinomadura pelletieri DSM 43383]
MRCPKVTGPIKRSVTVLPQGVSKAQFAEARGILRAEAGHYGGDIAVQGSRAKYTGPNSDIEIAIRVSAARFNQAIRERFGTPNPRSAKEDTMLHAMRVGRIQAGEAGLRRVRKQLERVFGLEADLSVVRIGGQFDQRP